jgi:hypothetical protein
MVICPTGAGIATALLVDQTSHMSGTDTLCHYQILDF